MEPEEQVKDFAAKYWETFHHTMNVFHIHGSTYAVFDETKLIGTVNLLLTDSGEINER